MNAWMRTEIDLNESEIDLNKCEHFLKANWDQSEMTPRSNISSHDPDKGLSLKTLDLILHISAVHQHFYILICISTLPTQHNT